MSTRPNTPDSFPEPLTARELEILRYMAEGAHFGEIAQRLHLSPTTVKWYSQQIYGKLGIDHAGQKRRLAVARARALGLLEPERTPTGRPRYSLPVPSAPIVGRERELDELAALYADPAVRLVTLSGPGGIGKTRLAVEFAWHLVEPATHAPSTPFPDGVYFVPLQALQSAEHVLWEIASAIGYTFPTSNRSPLEQLLGFFREKRLLLVMDNFEHLLDAASLIGDILQAAPHVHVLVTSRQVLGLSAEMVYAVDGLPYAAEPSERADDLSDAARLFVQSARQVLATFELQPDDEPWLHRICQQVEGMPLAIKLAAAWVTTLSLAEIATDILCCPEYLAAEIADIPPRQWSIRALFEPTWARLSPGEQAAFMRMAVFRSGGMRDAIQAVTGASLPVLQGLVKKSVISRAPDGRFRIHELLRQFAEERLIAAGDADAAYDAHCAHYATLLQGLERGLIDGDRQLDALAQLDAEFENVRQAWDWAVERRRTNDLARMAWPVGWFLNIRGRAAEGQAWSEPALEWCNDSALCARLMGSLAHFSEQLGRRREGLQWARVSAEIARELGDPALLAFALRQLGVKTATVTGDCDQAHHLLDESLSLWQSLGDAWGEALGWMGKAVVARSWPSNDYAAALAYTETTLRLLERTSDRFLAAHAYMNGGVDCIELGDREKAVRYLEEALARYRALNAPVGVAFAVANLAALYEHAGHYEAAIDGYQQAIALAREYNHLELVVGNLMNYAGVLATMGRFDEAAACMKECHLLLPAVELASVRPRVLFAEAWISWKKGDIEAAYQAAQAALEIATAKGIASDASLSHIGMALAEIHLERLEDARENLRAGLRTALTAEWLPFAVYVLAALHAAEDNGRQAVEYAALVEQHPATSFEVRHWAKNLLAELSGALPPAEYADAVARGRALDAENVLRAFLQDERETLTPG